MHQGQVVGDRRHVGEDFRDPGAGLAVALELSSRTQQLRLVLGETFHESEALALEE